MGPMVDASPSGQPKIFPRMMSAALIVLLISIM